MKLTVKKRTSAIPRAAVLSALGMAILPTSAATFELGDIFAAVNNGNVKWYRADGTFVDTLNIGTGGFTTGMAFDGSGNLYVTGFSANRLARFDTTGARTSDNFATGLSTPESVVFDKSGNLYVGNLNNGIRKYDSAGNFLGTVTGGRVDWFDLTADQSTFLYTQEASAIKTVSNGLPGVAGANFATGVGDFALRILADGSVLVANNEDIKHLDSTGAVIGSYDVAGEDSWFALNINPDGTSFWSGNISSGKAYEFDIASGAVTQTLDTGVGSQNFFGLVIFGEKTEGGPPPPVDSVPDGGSSAVLFGLGLCGLGFLRRRK